jgi:hypothetical protein
VTVLDLEDTEARMRLAAFVGGWAGVEDPEITVDCLRRDRGVTEDDEVDPRGTGGELAPADPLPCVSAASSDVTGRGHQVEGVPQVRLGHTPKIAKSWPPRLRSCPERREFN